MWVVVCCVISVIKIVVLIEFVICFDVFCVVVLWEINFIGSVFILVVIIGIIMNDILIECIM